MKFTGRTEDAAAPFLGAEFWKKGTKIIGRVVRTFKSANGDCYAIRPAQATQVNGETCEEVSVGNLTGFLMALQAAGLDRLQVGDVLYLECTGFAPTTKGHERANFYVEVERNSAAS
jgi:hypothetical protein